MRCAASWAVVDDGVGAARTVPVQGEIPSSIGVSCRATVAATTIARGGWAVMLRGPSGSGKSDLALRAICTPVVLPKEAEARPFELVSDDQTEVRLRGNVIVATPPAVICGLLEVRGVGIQRFAPAVDVPIALVVDLMPGPLQRMPEYPGPVAMVLGRPVDVISLNSFECSAPIKLALALARSHAAIAGQVVER